MKNVIGVSLGAAARTSNSRHACWARRCACAASAPTATWPGRRRLLSIGTRRPMPSASGWPRTATAGCAARRRPATRPDCARGGDAPFSNGARLADILLEWAVRHAQSTLGHYFDNARVLFFSGLSHQKLALSMAEYTPNLHFADPVLQLGSPKLLTSLDALGLYASGMHYVADWVPRRLLSAALLEQWAQLRAAPRGATCHRGGRAGARARRPRPGGTGRQDDRHPHRQRRAPGAPSRTRACTW